MTLSKLDQLAAAPGGGGTGTSGAALPQGRPTAITTADVADAVAATYQADGSTATTLVVDDDDFNLGFTVFAVQRAGETYPWLVISSDENIYFGTGSADPVSSGASLSYGAVLGMLNPEPLTELSYRDPGSTARALMRVSATDEGGGNGNAAVEFYLQPAGGGTGQLTVSGLPTTDPGVADAVWNDGGTLKISAG